MRVGTGASACLGVLLAAGCTTTAAVAPGATGNPVASRDQHVTTLAKVDGWRDGSAGGSPDATLEIAYDDAAARAMWAEVVDTDLPRATGDPTRPGVYGDLDDVDLDDHVIGLYSGGESGSCPRWVGEIGTRSGTVAIVSDDAIAPDQLCTADFRRYRVVVAIDRDAVPPVGALGGTHVRYDGYLDLGSRVVEYSPAG